MSKDTAIATQSTTLSAPDKSDREISYVPFGSADQVKLSARIVQNIICKPTARGALPSDNEAIKFLMMCQASRLNPFANDCYLVGYDGQSGPEFSMITSIQAFLKRAEVSPEFDGLESGVIVTENDGRLVDLEGEFYTDHQKLQGAWARVHFKTRKVPMLARVKFSTFAKNSKFWKDNPGGMIVKCAKAAVLRASFPTMLGGLYTEEESSDPISKAVPLPSEIAAAAARRTSKGTPLPAVVQQPQPPKQAEDDGDLGPQQPADPPTVDAEVVSDPDPLKDEPATEQPPQGKAVLPNEILTQLETLIADKGVEALKFFRKHKWLAEGETFELLPIDKARQVLANSQNFLRKLGGAS